jgi:hypothetical protein
MAAIWAYDPPNTLWATKTWVERTFGPTLESWGALSFGRGELGPYEFYGKGFFLVYLAMVPIVLVVHDRYRAAGGTSRWELWTCRFMVGAVIVAAAGDFATYWGISVPGPVGAVLWSGGFGVELMSDAVLIASTTLYGIISLWLRIVPRWASMLLVAWLPISIYVLGNVVAYIPNGYVVPLSVTWGLVGVWLLVRPTEVAVAEPA